MSNAVESFAVVLANITGNIPCIFFLIAGVYLVNKGCFIIGSILLIASYSLSTTYRTTSKSS